ncbi:MAG: ferritin family protein [Acidobacteriota bacterium]|nr:ferritin family protein [Acidobacteriota bacterium]
MTIDSKLKGADVYPIAIRAEMDAAGLYRDLQGRVRNEALRQKLDFLAKEEDRHKAILERLFHDHFPDRKLVVPAESKRPQALASVDESTRVVSLFKLAMLKEKEAEEYYKGAKALTGDAQAKRILDYLARVERSHYYMLKSEIDLLERFPDYYNVEDAHEGQDLFHIGA